MKRLLGPLLLAPLLVLTACGGDDSSEVAVDPATPTASSSTASPSSPSSSASESGKPGDGTVEILQEALLSQTAAGGRVALDAVRLDDQGSRDGFVGQFETPGFGKRIARKVAAMTAPEGSALIGAVVSIGCDVPPGVTVSGEPDAWTITPMKVEDPLQECLAPVTTVAVVAVPAA